MYMSRCKNTASESIYLSRDQFWEMANQQYLDFKIVQEAENAMLTTLASVPLAMNLADYGTNLFVNVSPFAFLSFF